MRGVAHKLAPIVALLCACLWCPSSLAASSPESVVLHASFSPERLGASTTIGFGFEISGPGGAVPSPLRNVALRLPRASTT